MRSRAPPCDLSFSSPARGRGEGSRGRGARERGERRKGREVVSELMEDVCNKLTNNSLSAGTSAREGDLKRSSPRRRRSERGIYFLFLSLSPPVLPLPPSKLSISLTPPSTANRRLSKPPLHRFGTHGWWMTSVSYLLLIWISTIQIKSLPPLNPLFPPQTRRSKVLTTWT